MELPDKLARPRTFDYSPYRYQWRSGRMPPKIVKDGTSQANPFSQTALFVVHGIGDQKDTETATAMRWGVEDSLPLIDPGLSESNQWILPAPYINDGHWAQYDNLTTFKADIGADLDILTDRQRTFFTNLWRDRTRGWFRSWAWIVVQGGRMVVKGSWLKKPFYSLLTVLLAVVMFIGGVWPKSRKFVVLYVNDARLYLEPRGDIEHEIVQLIDRRVARGFLKTMGLDLDFAPLEDYDGVLINGRSHHFERVTWAAHSLGTLISFNVIGDLLHQCIAVREKHAAANGQDYLDECPVAERVEQALSRFVTFGSPLDKICFLYETKDSANSVLRRWPQEYLPGNALDLREMHDCDTDPEGQDAWWTNIFYGSDPISGPLDTVERFLGIPKGKRLIRNISTFGWRLPLMSHQQYWRDTGMVSKILAQSYTGFTRNVLHGFTRPGSARKSNVCFVRSWPTWIHGLLSAFGLFWITILVVAAIIYTWINWETIGPWIEKLI